MKTGRKLITALALFSILVQSVVFPLSKSFAYAQEATITPTESPSPTPTEITPTETPSVSVAPTETPTPAISPTPQATPVPSETTQTPTPSAENIPNENKTENTSQPNAPPATNPTVNPTPEASPTVTVSPQPDSTGNEQVAIAILKNVAAPSIDLGSAQSEGSASLTTDKADYAPTDAALITGNGFNPGETYTIYITSSDEPAVNFETKVTADQNGSFAYAYQLDGNYRPNYKVEAKDSAGNIVATVTFTDTPVKITAKSHEGQEKVSGVLNGYTSGNVTEYSEGDTINFRFELEATHGPTSGQLEIRYSGDDGNCLFFDGSFTLGSIETISGSQPTVTTVGSPTQEDFGTSNGEWVQLLNINYLDTFGHDDPDSKTRVNYTLKLSNEAGQCNGSSQHSRLDPAGGSVEQSGQQNVPVPANQVIELPDIIVTKNIDRNGDGSFESTAVAGEYSFTLDGTTSLSTDASGQAIFTDVTPNGTHTITETQLDFSQGTYQFASGSGTNCSFSGSTATATVASGTTATNATCIFNNAQQNGTVVVHKDVQGPNGEAATDNTSFSVELDGANTQSITESTSVTYSNVSAGSHTITENTPLPTGYTLYGISTTAGGSGNTGGLSVNVTAGQTTNVYVTNRQPGATIIVEKQTDPDEDQANFTFTGDAAGSISDGQQITVSNLAAGTYTSTETVPSGWDLTDISCDDTDSRGSLSTNTATFQLTVGETVKCTFTNTKRSHIIIEKNSILDSSQEFTFNNDFGNDNPDTFILTDDSTPGLPSYDAEVTPGSYSVSEDAVDGWKLSDITCDDPTQNSSGNLPTAPSASINVAAGETVTCTFTNKKLATINLVKNTIGGDGTFDFTMTGETLPSSAQIETSENTGNQTFSDIDPDNSYTIEETSQSGWDPTDASCDNGDLVSNITPNAGEVITCTFTNTKRGEIIVEKQTDPEGSDQSFEFDPNYGDSFFLQDGDSNNSGFLEPGTYSVTELQEDGWDTNISCSDGSDAQSIGLEAGETVTCTFTNTQRSEISGTKYEVNADDSIVGVLSDWIIYLFTGETQIDQTTTDFAGNFFFGNLVSGTYSLVEDLVDGWSQRFAPSEITLNPGQSSTENSFGNFKNGSIQGVKFEDLNGDGEQCVYDEEEGEDICDPTLSDWTIFIDKNEDGQLNEDEISTTTGEDGNYEFSDLGPGTYSICEEEQESWIRSKPLESNCESVTISRSGQSSTVDFGNYRQARITVVKDVVNPNDNPVEDTSTDFDFNVTGQDPFQLTDGQSEVIDLDPGSYEITENPSNNYSFEGCDVGDPIENEDGTGVSVTVTSGQDIIITCKNKQKKGTITGLKWDDRDGDGRNDEEPGLPGWHIRLLEDNDGSIGDQVGNDELTNQDGTFTFESVNPGSYWLCEVNQAGWNQTYPDNDSQHPRCWRINLSSNDEITDRDFGNQQQNPILTISKINNKTGVDLSPGADVTYSITIEATQSAVKDVKVTDLLPLGFKYRGGSWTATLNGAPISLTEPTYASPGVWMVGDMDVNDKVVLSYIADIDGSEQPGLYKDVAWAEGKSLDSSQVLANAIIPGKVDDNFVGTEINIVKETQSGVSVNIETKKTEEVLGASTSLPSTGGKTIWIILASMMLTTGFSSIILGLRLKPKKRRKHV